MNPTCLNTDRTLLTLPSAQWLRNCWVTQRLTFHPWQHAKLPMAFSSSRVSQSTAEHDCKKEFHPAQLPFTWSMGLSVYEKQPCCESQGRNQVRGLWSSLATEICLVYVLAMLVWHGMSLRERRLSRHSSLWWGGSIKSLPMSLRDACSLWVTYMEMEEMPYLWTGGRHRLPVSSRGSSFLLGIFFPSLWRLLLGLKFC